MAAKLMKRSSSSTSPREKFEQAREAMKGSLVERDEEIDLVLTALIAQEHPLLVGPPGTGKSLLGDSVVRWMGGCSRFSILLTKFSTPEEVFGPISVQGLKADQYRRITTGKLPEAEIAFVDEIFKASSAILNTMLRILNERSYDNGDGEFSPCPLVLAIAASNEWPDDSNGGKELGALLDRFLFRKKVKPVSPSGRKTLLKRAVAGNDCHPTFPENITHREVEQAHVEADALPWEDGAKKSLWTIIEELNKEGIHPGDRRLYKAIGAARAFAYLSGGDKVETPHLDILSHVLWDDPQEQPEKAAKIVAKIANPTSFRVTELLMQVEDVLAKCKPVEAVPKLQSTQKELSTLPRSERVEKATAYVASCIKEAYNKVIGAE